MQAEDERYGKLIESENIKPNEKDLQVNSGVLKTLTDLPYYNDYVPNQYQYKEGLVYNMYGRPTLAYSPDCAYSVSDAILVLS